MAKMTRAEKRRRKVAKLVEMKLDGVEPPYHWRAMNYEELYRYHRNMLYSQGQTTYYGAGMAQVLNHKAQEIQRSIDRAILEELNGEPISTD